VLNTVGSQSNNTLQVTLPVPGTYCGYLIQAYNNDNTSDAFAFRVISFNTTSVTVSVTRVDTTSGGWNLNLQFFVVGLSASK
jgi:hypothetical protein